MASYTPFLEYAASPDIDTDTTLISSFSDNRIISSFVIANSGSSSASVEMYLADSLGNKLASILSGYSVGTGRSQTLDVNSLNLPATYQIIVNSDGADVDFIASGVRISATYTGDAESVIEEYTEAAKALIDLYIEDVSKPSIDDYVENTSKPSIDDYIENTSKPEIDAYVSDALGEAVENAEASATAAATSETNAATSETNAAASATAAATSESNAAASETAAETAATNAETYYNNIDSNVASAIASVHTETPSLSIPFNESGKLDYGVGTEYVSGLPVYGVDFTRSTTSTVINKSGVLETLAADEMGIGSEGVWLHGTYTNLVEYSEDLSQSTWLKLNGGLVDGTNGIIKVNTNSSIRETTDLGTVSEGDSYRLSFLAKSGASSTVSFTTFFAVGAVGGYRTLVDLGSKEVTAQGLGTSDITISSISDDWVNIEVTLSITHESYTSLLINFTAGDDSYAGDGSTVDILVTNVQLITGSATLPYLPTSGTTASATATSCTVPVSGNLPATGYPFTTELDTNVTDTSESGRELITVADQTSTTCFEGISLESDGDVTFSSGTDGQGDVSLGVIFDNTAYVDGGNNRISFAYDEDAETVTCYVNGTVNSTGAVSVSGMTLPYDGNLELGNNLNAQMKNVNLYAYTASADEIASWGAPK